ncbi:serine O-acetyltransferase [Flavobacteriaceae bacterium 14752]|uniref:serine O-acetyltransferase n=1 Tax=Mesohalobacter salilacus TaxID=2491711 RepID=UPI000F6313DD|nr:serine acetyltransferase [Flavobacteriaceae bacterium 14752]
MSIKNKKELRFFLEADKFALKKIGKPNLLGDYIWKFQILLRKCEYYRNKNGVFKLYLKYLRLRKNKLAYKLGLDIPENVFGPGLRINHFGNIVINGKCRIGMWCDIHQGVNIGASNPTNKDSNETYTPKIGNNVWIGPGAKIYGPINVGSNVQIGANAVINKSFQSEVTVAGVPAKVISEKGTSYVDIVANPKNTLKFFDKFPEYIKYKNFKH